MTTHSNVFSHHKSRETEARMTPNLPTLHNDSMKSSTQHKRVYLNNAHLLRKKDEVAHERLSVDQRPYHQNREDLKSDPMMTLPSNRMEASVQYPSESNLKPIQTSAYADQTRGPTYTLTATLSNSAQHHPYEDGQRVTSDRQRSIGDTTDRREAPRGSVNYD